MLQAPGYEADDLIGCLAKRAEKEGFDVFMMTPDKDFAQLVSDKIRMFRPGRGGNPASVWGPEEVKERYGLERPEQVIDLLGLMGDSADNIPGVPGVGEKTAIKFLQAYGSMEGLYEHVDELKGKMKEKVEANKELAFLSRELATIVVDIDFAEDFAAMAMEPADASRAGARAGRTRISHLGQTVARRRLHRCPCTTRLDFGGFGGGRGSSDSSDDGQLSMFDAALDVAPSASTLDALDKEASNYALVDDPSAMNDLVTALRKAGRFAFDTETTGLNAMEASLVGMSFSAESGTGSYVPVHGRSWEAIRAVFQPLLEDPEVTIVGQNLKFDGKIMARHGVDLTRAKLEDTMVAHYLLEPDQPHGMDALAQAFLGYQCIPITDLIGKKGKNQKSMADLPPEDVVDYACEDADVTLRLADVLMPKLAEEGLDGLFRDIEMPLLSVLMHMEMEGVALDTNHLSQFSATLAENLDALQTSIQGHAGIPFNVDSPKQLGEVLFEHLEIPAKVKKTKTGQYPTSEAVLSKLKDKHPIVAEVLEYRKLKKLRSTYVEPLPALILEETGRVHTTYMQVVAATGRLSSKDPNLQNIPIRTEQGREIRKAFVPRDQDHVLVAADYSQVELRIAAAMSKERGLIEAFQKGKTSTPPRQQRCLGWRLKTSRANSGARRKRSILESFTGKAPLVLPKHWGFRGRRPRASSTRTTRNSLALKPSPKPAWQKHENQAWPKPCWADAGPSPTSSATMPLFAPLQSVMPSTRPFRDLLLTSSSWP